MKNFVICDTERRYARNLLQILSGKKDTGFQMYLIHSLEELKMFAKQKPIHILLAAEEFPLSEREKIPAGKKFILIKGTPDSLLEEETGIFRYQSAEKIWVSILESSAEEETKQTAGAVGGNGELIGVYSPVHRIGKTKFALDLGCRLAQKQPVLYLNLEGYSGENLYFSGEKAQNLGDLLYYARQERGNLGIRVSAMVLQKEKLDYIAPMPYVQDLQAVRCEEWRRLFQQILEQCIYEKVILDLGDSVNGLFQILDDCAKIYTLYAEGSFARAKLKQYVDNLRRTGLESVLEKTVQKKVKSQD